MNYLEIVKQAIEKRNRILTNKKEEILLLGNKKASIDEELKENEKEFFKFVDDPEKVESYEEKKKEKENIDKKIEEVKSQIALLESTFYVDYDIRDIEKELKKVISDSEILKDLEKVEKKINELKELAATIEIKRDDISREFGNYIQSTRYLPDEKQVIYGREMKDLLEKELNMKIANSDITAFMDHVSTYYRKHEKIFK